MVQKKTFAILGGDLRQAHLANTLASRENGYKIYGMFLEKDVKLSSQVHSTNNLQLVLPQSDVIVFPLPLLDSSGRINTPLSAGQITIEDCIDYISPDAVVMAGKVPEETTEAFARRGIEIVDYLKREEFAVMNAIPSALVIMLSRICFKYNVFILG